MQVSIIPADKTIVIDGEALIFDFVLWSKKIHAIQWNGANGTIEFKTGAAQWFDNLEMIQDVIDAYFAEKQRLADEAAAALND
jgi:hypothetical protein